MSDRTANRIARILALIPYVIKQGVATIDDLVERFGYADRKEVVKDLQLVFLTGLPGYGPGDLIDVDIFDDEVTIDAAEYFAQPMRLTPAEALGLLAAGSTYLASHQAPPALATAMEKLSVAVGADGADAVLFHVEAPPVVSELRAAIDQRQLVRIGYLSIASNERTERIVEGESVFFNLGNWYFSGFCRLADAERVFRVDRIDQVVALDEPYEPSGRDASSIVRYEPTPEDHVVTFTVGPASRWVTEYYPGEVEPLDSGGIRFTMHVSNPMVAARLLLRLGHDATLEAGDAVAAARDDLQRRIAARYA